MLAYMLTLSIALFGPSRMEAVVTENPRRKKLECIRCVWQQAFTSRAHTSMYQGCLAADLNSTFPPDFNARCRCDTSSSISMEPGVNQSMWSMMMAMLSSPLGRPRSTLLWYGVSSEATKSKN